MKVELIKNHNTIKSIIKKRIPSGLLMEGRVLEALWIQRQMQANPILPYKKGVYPGGINLIGSIDAATGLGQSFRLVESVIKKTGIPYVIYPYEEAEYPKEDIEAYKNKICQELKYSINLWHVSPLKFGKMYSTVGREAFNYHYNISFWLWELENFPDEWVGYEQVLDEIWTPSDFISQAIMKKIKKPVYTIPYSVKAEVDLEKYDREYFHLPKNVFLFLMMYDSNSISDRKNPDAAIEAFKKAFSRKQTDVMLVIKVGSLSSKEYRVLAEKIEGYRNIRIINGTFDKVAVNSLISCADAVVSLHRAEGFGLVLAEAMLNGIPVIATNWSANTEFMNKNCGCMISYRFINLNKNSYPYKKGERWAEPNIEEAAHYMVLLKENNDYRTAIKEEAVKNIQEKLGEHVVSEKVLSRLNSILY